MFLKLLFIGVVIMAICIGIGTVQNNNISLSNQLNGCYQISDSNGYLGFQCFDKQVYVPASERDQLK